MISHGVADFKPFDGARFCTDFISRLGHLCRINGYSIQAWALMPNHFHLCLTTGNIPLGTFMHHLLSGFSNYLNKSLDRRGHVFMNRFKSILVDRDEYLLELVRYIHLNPAKNQVVIDSDDMSLFRWTGHPAIMGRQYNPWQDVDGVLSRFSSNPDRARALYLGFLGTGSGSSDERSLDDGVYLIGKKGIAQVDNCTVDQRRYDFSGAVLGGRDFTASIARDLCNGRHRIARSRDKEHKAIEKVIQELSMIMPISLDDRATSVRTKCSTEDRCLLCRILEACGVSRADTARLLGMTRQGVCWLLSRRRGPYEQASTADKEMTRYIELFMSARNAVTGKEGASEKRG